MNDLNEKNEIILFDNNDIKLEVNLEESAIKYFPNSFWQAFIHSTLTLFISILLAFQVNLSVLSGTSLNNLIHSLAQVFLL